MTDVLDSAHRSGCPINLAVEVMGDRWSLVVLRDVMFGDRHYFRERTYNELAPLLEITTALDPKLYPAYQFGASFLAPAPPNGAGQPDRAIKLMEYGIEHNPESWQLYYNLGFVYYTELHDYKKAGETFARGSSVPGAHPFMKVLAAQMAQHLGDGVANFRPCARRKQLEGAPQNARDRVAWVERSVGVLKHNLHIAAERAPAFRVQARKGSIAPDDSTR